MQTVTIQITSAEAVTLGAIARRQGTTPEGHAADMLRRSLAAWSSGGGKPTAQEVYAVLSSLGCPSSSEEVTRAVQDAGYDCCSRTIRRRLSKLVWLGHASMSGRTSSARWFVA